MDSINDDFTRNTGKICYEEHSNKLVGFVLPLKNGCPQKDILCITLTVKSMVKHFNLWVPTNFEECTTAKCTDDSVPLFCLSI